MVGLLAAWWPFLVLMYLPRVANLIAVVVFRVVRSRLDHAIPDELPETAGVWVQRQLQELGLHAEIRVAVTDGEGVLSIDGYHPRERVIQLTPETHFKRDPVYWAIAAHELGHARFRLGHPVASALIAAAAWIKWGLVSFGLGTIVGNALFAVPGVTLLGFQCLAVALVLDALVLVEEIVASVSAGCALRRAGFTPAHARAARLVLSSAFATYFTTFLSHALLLSQWQQVIAITGPARLGEVAATPPATWTMVLVAIGSAFGLVHAAVRVFVAMAPALAHQANRTVTLAGALFNVLWKITLPLLLWALWDQRSDEAWAWCVLLAVIPALGTLLAVLHLPALILYVILHRWIVRLGGRAEIERSKAYRDAHHAGRSEMAAGKALITAVLERAAITPPLAHRLAEVVKLLYLPLLVAYWIG